MIMVATYIDRKRLKPITLLDADQNAMPHHTDKGRLCQPTRVRSLGSNQKRVNLAVIASKKAKDKFT